MNKKDGTYRYLLDDILEQEGHERMRLERRRRFLQRQSIPASEKVENR